MQTLLRLLKVKGFDFNNNTDMMSDIIKKETGNKKGQCECLMQVLRSPCLLMDTD